MRITHMTGSGTVKRIFTAPEAEAEMEERTEVEAVAGRGLRGDRYFSEIETGTFVEWGPDEERHGGYDLTLIEQEAVTAIEREAGIELAPGEHRRNIETSDVALNHLVGQRFRVGNAICRGDRLCEPCNHLQRITQDGVLQALTHRGGLRVDILEDGMIRAGDGIEPLE
jgi:MOSC domain-containing protein YiiM